MIDLAHATIVVDKSLEHGRTLGLPPLTVAVLDAAGCLVSFKREDGTSLLRPDIAQAKAYGALALGIGSRAIAQPRDRDAGRVDGLGILADRAQP